MDFDTLQSSLNFMEFQADERYGTGHFWVDTPAVEADTAVIILTCFLNQCSDVFAVASTSHAMHDHDNRFAFIGLLFRCPIQGDMAAIGEVHFFPWEFDIEIRRSQLVNRLEQVMSEIKGRFVARGTSWEKGRQNRSDGSR